MESGHSRTFLTPPAAAFQEEFRGVEDNYCNTLSKGLARYPPVEMAPFENAPIELNCHMDLVFLQYNSSSSDGQDPSIQTRLLF